MKRNLLFVGTFAVMSLFSCSSEEGQKQAENKQEQGNAAQLLETAKGVFATLPARADNPENPVTPEKVALGKKLYFDVRLSKDDKISCNSCHQIENFGVDNLPVSPGNDGKTGERNSPTVLNAALHIAQFWDGRAKDVEEQAGGPILNPIEMAAPSEEFVMKKLAKDPEYVEMFKKAFPDEKSPMTYQNLQKAIGAFERTLITTDRFDDFLNGNTNALTQEEQEGLQLFIETGCTACHRGALLGGDSYQKFGVFADYWTMTGSEKHDEGRFTVTKNEADKYVFKVPSLRNVAKTAPYFHDGSVQKLEDAVKIMAKLQLNKDLTEDQIKKITKFLKSLTAKEIKAEWLPEKS